MRLAWDATCVRSGRSMPYSLFQSTHPAWDATAIGDNIDIEAIFQSTRLAWGATEGLLPYVVLIFISIHASRTGRDTSDIEPCFQIANFKPHTPLRARLRCRIVMTGFKGFQSMRPVRGATSRTYSLIVMPSSISIHTPRSWRDTEALCGLRRTSHFNPRAPRGARHGRTAAQYRWLDFNPRAPRGARRRLHLLGLRLLWISIHAPLAGRDGVAGALSSVGLISIHASRAGRDSILTIVRFSFAYFNPRASRGARHQIAQSNLKYSRISILAPRAGRDLGGCSSKPRQCDFNPRALRGARHSFQPTNHPRFAYFNPRALRGARRDRSSPNRSYRNFNPRALRGARLFICLLRWIIDDFNPRALRGARLCGELQTV